MATATTTQQDDETQGSCEIEICYLGEAECYRRLKYCDKNPGHVDFIPVDQFTVDHLPSEYQDTDIVNLVQAMSHLTVCLWVTHVSEKRPKTFPGSDRPFQFYNSRGKNVTRTGTGWIDSVEIYINGKCQCQECAKSHAPKTDYGQINIRTAAHVVYDDLEGAYTLCYLNFNKGNAPTDCGGVIKLSGAYRVRTIKQSSVTTGYGIPQLDWSELVYVTHDMNLIHHLKYLRGRWNILRASLLTKYERLSQNWTSLPLRHSEHTLTIIVSHPHGCSKMVSVGHRINAEMTKGNWSKYLYNTATCPGSSGAYVFIMGRDMLHWRPKFFHWGMSEQQKPLNESCYSLDEPGHLSAHDMQ